MLNLFSDTELDELLERFKIKDLGFQEIRRKYKEAQGGIKKLLREAGRGLPDNNYLSYQIWMTLKDVGLEPIVFLLMEFDEPRERTLLVTYLTKHRDLNPGVTGADLKSLGLRPGPQFGAILARVRQALIVGDIASDKESQLQYVRGLLTGNYQ